MAKTIGHFQILEKLGEGGMGEVYRARDTKLNRDVAIKVLPESLAAEPDRLARFEREAQALAALNHPNIAAVHAIVDRAIVMELVKGEDLSARVARGAMPLNEALPIARQVAEALAAAHDAGIVHRDLKPANIKVTDAGFTKVLDFGLAKAMGPAGSDGPAPTGGTDVANSPTLTARGTQMGMILGTAAYMAPEQARGRAVDKRADVWAFGCVLFEMLTGTRAFGGEDVTETLAFVMTNEPAFDTLPAATPPRVRELLRRCLTKNPHLRLRDIGDARLEIDDAMAGTTSATASAFSHASRTPRSRWFSILLAAGSAVVGLLIGGAIVWQTLRQSSPRPLVVHAALLVAPATELDSGRAYGGIGGARTALAWSPDGRTLAFVGRQGSGPRKIFVRDLGAESARPLEGTDGAENPVFSPDGREIAFTSGLAVRRTAVSGGPVVKICDAPPWVNGISWGVSRFVFVSINTIMQVSLATGRIEPLTTGLEGHASPYLLPGDSAIMFTQHDKQWTSGDERVMVQRLPGGAPTLLLPDAADARLLPTGQIVFLRQGTLFVAEFDASALKVTGSPRAVTKEVAQVVMAGISENLTLAGQFAISSTGALAYVSSPLVSWPGREMVSVDRTGKVTPLGGRPEAYDLGSSLSPDGNRIAVSVITSQEMRPYAFDLARGTLTPLVPSGKGEFVGNVWSPKTNIVAFKVYEGSATQLVLIDADNPSQIERVPDSDGFWPTAWSPDGTRLVGTRPDGDIWVYSRGASPPFQVLQTTPAEESHPSWSPDGKWLAYVSNTSDREEVYVRPYPGPGREIPISTTGGTVVSWSRDGRELFFIETGTGRYEVMAVSMANPAQPGTPTKLFAHAGTGLDMRCAPSNCYAVGTGSRQFVTTRDVTQPAKPVERINLILNWLELVGR